MGKKLFLFAAAAVALASCTETDLSGDTSFAKESTSDAIQFSAKAGNAGTTRAGVEGTITTASLKTGAHNAGFGVMGYHTGTTDYASNTAANFMYNEQVTWNASGYWTYDPVKYWPNGVDAANETYPPSNSAVEKDKGQKLSFFAYAPWVEVANGTEPVAPNYSTPTDITLPKTTGSAKSAFYTSDCSSTTLNKGIAAITSNTLEDDPQVYYYMPQAKIESSVDLLWGLRGSKQYQETDNTDNPDPALSNLGSTYNLNLTKQDVPETVNFLFKHALSKVGGNTKSTTSTTGQQKCGLKVVLDVDGNGNGINGVDNQSLYLGESGFDNTKTLVTIKSVAVQDGASAYADKDDNGLPETVIKSNLKNSGWFNLANGTWSDVNIIDNTGAVSDEGATYDVNATTAGAEGAYKLDKDIAEPTSEITAILNGTHTAWTGNGTAVGKPRGVTTTAKNVYSDENDVPSLLMIPAAAEQTLYVTVDYLVRTADKQLSRGYSQVEQVITNKVSLTGLDVNKYYTLVMHLGLTSVKFSAIVADWANSDNATYDEDGTHDGNAEAAEEVWLPSNVVAQTTTTTAAPGTASNVNTAASNTTYNITLNNLAENQKISAAASAANITAVKIGDTNITTTPYPVTTGETSKEIVVTLNANTKVKAVANLLTITQKDGSDKTLTTTTVNIVQSAFDIVLTEGTPGTVVNVKDGDNQNVTASGTGYTVEVVDSEGKTVENTNYTIEAGKITMNTAGVYTVKVVYNDGTDSITRTIDIHN